MTTSDPVCCPVAIARCLRAQSVPRPLIVDLLLKLHGLRVGEMAIQAGVSKRFLQAVIAGERRMPEDVRAVLGRTLGVDLWAEDGP